MKRSVLYPFLYCQWNTTGIDIVVQMYLLIKITADDYFVTSNGAVYDAIQTAYSSMENGYLHAVCLPSTIILCMPTKYHNFIYLSECFVHVSVCASVQLVLHSTENANMIIDVLHTILYLTFTAS